MALRTEGNPLLCSIVDTYHHNQCRGRTLDSSRLWSGVVGGRVGSWIHIKTHSDTDPDCWRRYRRRIQVDSPATGQHPDILD
ncbi:hypothetical protein CTA1_4050 [Colletotrichum tanaceti]|uniref:Uncharacterized protein n=1 Tax=Colletotrichum tanaceti TaxID=1306861 RepID=A0A4U6XG81_9PEZI|nr:hypothetical protein CTA1_4050 [Colletotrichum tanaceti]